MTKIGKMKSYASISDWKQDQSVKNKKLITGISKFIDLVAPGLETTVKWGQGCWTKSNKHKLFIHCKPDHVQLGFYNGSQLNDPLKLLQGKGKYVRHIKIFSVHDIDETSFKKIIKQVV